MRQAYSQIAYGKLYALLFNYVIWGLVLWLGFWDQYMPFPYRNLNTNLTLTKIVTLSPNYHYPSPYNDPILNPNPNHNPNPNPNLPK